MKKTLQRTLWACAIAAICGPTQAASISGQGTWETTLQGRDLDGNSSTFEAYYDTLLDITWLADGNYAMTSGYDDDGVMTWSVANTWAEGLSFTVGSTTWDQWRLPDANPVNGSAYNYLSSPDGSTDRGYNISGPGTIYEGSSASELAHMFYITLGNLGQFDPDYNFQSGYGLSNTGQFQNLTSPYWSGSEYSPGSGFAWFFITNTGEQGAGALTSGSYAWAVHAGDVGAAVVPIPAAVWLLGSSLLGLILIGRRAHAI